VDFNYSNKSLELQESLLKFFDEHIYPNEIDYDKAIEESGDPLHIPSVLEDLKEEAKIFPNLSASILFRFFPTSPLIS